ncbi:MAG: hypothetical protein R3E31_22120 [Chloroflexota bacterium]
MRHSFMLFRFHHFASGRFFAAHYSIWRGEAYCTKGYCTVGQGGVGETAVSPTP